MSLSTYQTGHPSASLYHKTSRRAILRLDFRVSLSRLSFPAQILRSVLETDLAAPVVDWQDMMNMIASSVGTGQTSQAGPSQLVFPETKAQMPVLAFQMIQSLKSKIKVEF